MTTRNCFNIRVYGICIENNHLLVSDEYVMDMYMTKLPGGGLEYGEGPVECLKRECLEEMDLKIDVTGHFYTTEFFQPTKFYKNTQLISIYYSFLLPHDHQLNISNKKFDFEAEKNGMQSFRWIPISELSPEDMTFPIDKEVVKKIKKSH
ncbi:NUDIX domain-containing protein [Marinilabilia rubra]|uniref:NUDIX hydrolase n=1 Tax=Marinilabilia rubra TaxID=2162893 RepID=A0A2U2B4M7_9BACT|nr:NUDIX domain-containing protein [Marinilabilia rubra]PWD98031.1 NUDIX hydrolase [Marinilabilia rubra]